MPLNCGLVDEPLARVGRRVGVVADDVDALRERLLQHRRDRDRIVGGEQDAVDAAGDVVVDELDLLVDLGLGRAVGLGLDVAELLGGVLDALRRCVEIADADQLRHVDDGDRLAGLVRRVGRLSAVIWFIGARRWRGPRPHASGLVGISSPPSHLAAAFAPVAQTDSAKAAAVVVTRYLDFIVGFLPCFAAHARLTP